ncbi:MAG: hypothetical protein ACK41U_04745 [Paracoccus sp. (in: a-proteobacteria)]|uniref:hypothetical protein n=1 Tax=Paracoccus sp. TaxID=267 RepID=UPI00391BFD51
MKLIFVLLAILAFVLAFLAELGLGILLGPGGQGATPGIGIRMLALIDVALIWALVLMLAEMTLPTGRLMRLQGIVTLIGAFFGVIGGIVLIFGTFTLLILMLSLLVAVPFGTAVYLAAWGSFPTGAAGAALALIMLLKLAGAGFLVLASPAMLKNKGLMVLLLFSLGSTFLTGFLIAFVPGIIASIADAIGALISAILGTIWLLVVLIGAVFAVIRMLRSVVPD